MKCSMASTRNMLIAANAFNKRKCHNILLYCIVYVQSFSNRVYSDGVGTLCLI